jgi:hypothetical protein
VALEDLHEVAMVADTVEVSSATIERRHATSVEDPTISLAIAKHKP